MSSYTSTTLTRLQERRKCIGRLALWRKTPYILVPANRTKACDLVQCLLGDEQLSHLRMCERAATITCCTTYRCVCIASTRCHKPSCCHQSPGKLPRVRVVDSTGALIIAGGSGIPSSRANVTNSRQNFSFRNTRVAGLARHTR